MSSGYSKTPLIKKLGVKEGFKILLINEPVNYFDMLGGLSVGVSQISLAATADFIHFFTKDKAALLIMLPKLKSMLDKNGMIWVSWPKKSSKVVTDVSGAVIREMVWWILRFVQ